MELSATDIDAILDALEELNTADGSLDEFRVCKEGKLVFAAYDRGRTTVLDPRIVLPRLMGAILERVRRGELELEFDGAPAAAAA